MTTVSHISGTTSADTSEKRRSYELLLLTYQDFSLDCNGILKDYGFGRAHHRVLHFVAHQPQITVSELLSIFQITKQSLSRVLSQLIDKNLITQRPGPTDRRKRLLELTKEGLALERRLWALSEKRIESAYKTCTKEEIEAYTKVLSAMLDDSQSDLVNGIKFSASAA
jgi:DNA-binding MarR family transcriptional regulator